MDATVSATPARTSARWSKYPSTRTTRVPAADRVPRFEEAVEEALLGEDRRFGRVQVLGLAGGRERPASESDRTAAVVLDDEEEPVAETVVRALALGARLEEPGLDEEVLGIDGTERFRKRIPRVGSVAEPERADHVLRDAALLEVARGRAVGAGEPFGVEPLRVGDGLMEPVAPVVARSVPRPPRNRDAEPPRERLDGFGEVEPVDLAHEADDVASGAAAEAVVEALVAVDRERRRPLVVKRAEALPRAAGLLQSRVVGDDLDDVRRAPELGEDVVVDVEIVTWTGLAGTYRNSRIVAPFPPSRASAARRLATEPCRRKCSRTASRRRPVPWPWMTRRRAAPERSA